MYDLNGSANNPYVRCKTSPKKIAQTNKQVNRKTRKKSRRLGQRFVCQLLKSICKPKSAGIPFFFALCRRKRIPDYWLRCPVKFLCAHTKRTKSTTKQHFFLGWCDSFGKWPCDIENTSTEYNANKYHFGTKNFSTAPTIAWMHVNENSTFISSNLCAIELLMRLLWFTLLEIQYKLTEFKYTLPPNEFMLRMRP